MTPAPRTPAAWLCRADSGPAWDPSPSLTEPLLLGLLGEASGPWGPRTQTGHKAGSLPPGRAQCGQTSSRACPEPPTRLGSAPPGLQASPGLPFRAGVGGRHTCQVGWRTSQILTAWPHVGPLASHQTLNFRGTVSSRDVRS